ncbi:unnamed protein product [Vitrella brassicaformis CCMP3155]|uniref:Uncharacterized protein n=4 Tax=Vitrella brassicaformis TaxID=1169539 RepID=A0A0G4G3Q2_VITBC|nr:unnamed protein product [Vitrella brassicaformis CCMP3155]|eukprot:CEM22577.1 unnamed protein product [Vitrella brassicaformis CCMP3155]
MPWWSKWHPFQVDRPFKWWLVRVLIVTFALTILNIVLVLRRTDIYLPTHSLRQPHREAAGRAHRLRQPPQLAADVSALKHEVVYPGGGNESDLLWQYRQMWPSERWLERHVKPFTQPPIRLNISHELVRLLDTPATTKVSAPFLAIIIPTVPRGNGTDYLNPTLAALIQQLDGSSAGGLSSLSSDDTRALGALKRRVGVLVYHAFEEGRAAMPHAALDKAEETYRRDRRVKIVREGHDYVGAPCSPAAGRRDEGQTPPGPTTRRHTCDVIHLFKTALHEFSLTPYFLLMEDDFVVCAGGVLALLWAMLKATRYFGQWSALRVSLGLNGLVLKRADIPLLSHFLYSNGMALPVDLLVNYWLSKRRVPSATAGGGGTGTDGRLRQSSAAYLRDRIPLVYRYNLMQHIGDLSAYPGYRFHEARPGLRCYETIGSYMDVFESFDLSRCPQDDIFPCHTTHPIAPLKHWGVGRAEGRDHGHELTLVAAMVGQACVDACRERGAECDATGFVKANSCGALLEHFPCGGGCWKGHGRVNPLYIATQQHQPRTADVGRWHAPTNETGRCVVGGEADRSTCQGHHEGTRRLCPCSSGPSMV